MKKNILSTFILTVFFAAVIVVISSFGNDGVHSVYARSGGSPGGRTDSPADNSNCTACHSGTINSGAGSPSISAPGLTSGYTPGETYTITASVSQVSINKFGFEVTAEEDMGNTKVGTFINTDATTRFPGTGNASVTHMAAGSNNSWSFDWTAPASGTGSVTFYGAFNATNGNGNTTGDNVYTTVLSVDERIISGINEEIAQIAPKLYPNPVVSNFRIRLNEEIDAVQIYNLKGEKVMSPTAFDNQIDVSHLASGIYFVRIESNGSVSSQKLIKK